MQTFRVGQEYSLEVTVTDQAVRQFAELTGDKNRVHLDDEYAATTIFKRRIAHGALLNGFISAALGMGMPGEGTIYLSQNIRYEAPVYIGDKVSIHLQIQQLLPKHNAAIGVSVTNGQGVVVAEGEAHVKLPRTAQPACFNQAA